MGTGVSRASAVGLPPQPGRDVGLSCFVGLH